MEKNLDNLISQLLGASVKEDSLTEATVTVNRKNARFMLGLLAMIQNYPILVSKMKRLKSSLAVNDDDFMKILGSLKDIAGSKEEESVLRNFKGLKEAVDFKLKIRS